MLLGARLISRALCELSLKTTDKYSRYCLFYDLSLIHI